MSLTVTDEEKAKAFVIAEKLIHRRWLEKPLTRSGWLDLLHRCQDGNATCLYVLEKIEYELEHNEPI